MLDRARRLFAQVLETPGGLKIQTIHAFCQSLLGRFPVEAQLEPGFEVMDERSAAEALASARELALTPEAGLKDAAGRVATRVTEQGFGELMAGLAADRGLLRRLIAGHGGSASLIRATRQALGLSDGVTRESVLDAALADSAMDGDGLKRLVDALATGTAAEQGRGAAIADFLAQPEDRQALLAGYRWIFLTQKSEPKKTVATGKTLQANPGLDDVIAAEQTRLRRLTDQLKSIEAAENTAALLALGGAVLRHYDHAKKQSGRVDYDDLIADAGALLAVPGVAAWVLYKLDGGIDHILVDEAQDTNPDQWRVIDAIAEEFFAGAGA
ncbi:MAG: UvrD-helicase domain-containing protein, partial [Sphingomonadales bacterium]|nr:UvrD-helicase domain-containing protein [Sphingomonadales bacterium]